MQWVENGVGLVQLHYECHWGRWRGGRWWWWWWQQNWIKESWNGNFLQQENKCSHKTGKCGESCPEWELPWRQAVTTWPWSNDGQNLCIKTKANYTKQWLERVWIQILFLRSAGRFIFPFKCSCAVSTWEGQPEWKGGRKAATGRFLVRYKGL